nr:hypothetical protein [uncultured Rhodopila sp.]
MPIDIVIITAVLVEFEAVRAHLHPDGKDAWDVTRTTSDGPWYVCDYKSSSSKDMRVRIALVQSRGTGLSYAACLATLGIQLFRPTYVVMLGVTAGSANTTIGDVIVPSELWDYGAGKWEDIGGKLVFTSRIEQVPIQEHVRQWSEVLAKRPGLWKSVMEEWFLTRVDEARPSVPKVLIGKMVSGAAVVDAKAIWDQVFSQDKKVIALDMEAYAVARAVHLATNPKYSPYCLIAKAVCDYGFDKRKDAQTYAAFLSVKFFKAYLDEVIFGIDSEQAPMHRHIPVSE